GASYQQVIAGMVSSPEYFSNATASTNQAWLTQVYQTVLQRPPDAAGQTFWTSFLNAGAATPNQVALQIELSAESEAIFVQQAYQQYLGHGASAADQALGVNFLTSGGTREQFDVSLTSSPEYFQKAGATDVGFLQSLYQDALGRPIDPL